MGKANGILPRDRPGFLLTVQLSLAAAVLDVWLLLDPSVLDAGQQPANAAITANRRIRFKRLTVSIPRQFCNQYISLG
jgi:hypothetical protein